MTKLEKIDTTISMTIIIVLIMGIFLMRGAIRKAEHNPEIQAHLSSK